MAARAPRRGTRVRAACFETALARLLSMRMWSAHLHNDEGTLRGALRAHLSVTMGCARPA